MYFEIGTDGTNWYLFFIFLFMIAHADVINIASRNRVCHIYCGIRIHRLNIGVVRFDEKWKMLDCKKFKKYDWYVEKKMTFANTELQLPTTLQIYNNFIDPRFSFSPFDVLWNMWWTVKKTTRPIIFQYAIHISPHLCVFKKRCD